MWHERYEKAGLAVVGVHSPEFSGRSPTTRCVEATRKLGVRYPVVQDNDFAIWRRYGVRAWPTAGRSSTSGGVVRYRHIGEGDYAETEARDPAAAAPRAAEDDGALADYAPLGARPGR